MCWRSKVTARLAALRAGGDEIAVSDLARTECLAKLLASGDAALVADYQAFFADPVRPALAADRRRVRTGGSPARCVRS